MRYTEYHAGKAVIKDRKLLPGAMEKLAAYENTGLTPEQIMGLKERMNDGWISVEEYAPEDGQLVLCCDDEAVYLVEYQGDWDAPFGDIDDIIAWRPLPEPYRPKKESEGSRRLREREEFFKE